MLTPEQIRGLFAELEFLAELIHKYGCAEAVAAWLGPERSHQDFIFGNAAVEVKSLSGAERNSVSISSEDQLESLNNELFLRIYRLSNLRQKNGENPSRCSTVFGWCKLNSDAWKTGYSLAKMAISLLQKH